MRRWNGWGDDGVAYPLPEGARRFLESLVGAGTSPQEASFETVLNQVPASRLPAHSWVSTDPAVRLLHACGQSFTDWVTLRSGRVPAFPDGVAYPTNAAEVRGLLEYARQAGASLIPYGGGTSVVGHLQPVGEAPVLTVDLSRMNRLLRFDECSKLATFGAGVCGPDLEAQLRARGCTLGHYPQSFEYSTLGGWVATRSSGQQSLGYGRIEKLFAGGQVETPAGTLELPPFPASAAGPDLRELVLGSEGRLGLITEATVRALPLPEREEFQAVFFPSFEQGLAAVQLMLRAPLPLSMLRLSTPTETQTTLILAGHERLIGMLEQYLSMRGLGPDKCMLLIGFTGKTGIVKQARAEALQIAGNWGGVSAGRTFGKQWHKSRFRTPYLRNTLWELGYGIDTLETAVSWDSVPVLMAGVEQALHQAMAAVGERVHVFTHLSHLYPTGSSVYTTYLFRLSRDPAETLARWQAMKSAASQAILKHGGTISHQHGIGLDHRPYLEAEKGELGVGAIRAALAFFDPGGMMNPGKLA